MSTPTCFECDLPGDIHMHHVVPRSAGGTKTVPLCERCHGLAHSVRMSTSALTKAAMKRKAAKGEFLGGPRAPYGFNIADDGVALVEVEAEQVVIADARALRAAGLSLRAVAGKLARRGSVSRAGRVFCPQQIRRMVKP